MNSYNYAFPKSLGSGDDPFIGLIEVANQQYPGFVEWVIDGGAGIGSFVDRVLKGATRCGVIAYEPLPENVKVLDSRFSGVNSVEIREAALGNKSTNVSFEVPERTGIQNHPLWTPGTSPEGYVRKLGFVSRIKGIAKKLLRRRLESISVNMVRLDSDLNVSPDVIKLDLQGGEPEALVGLGSLLARTKVVKIEVQMLDDDTRIRSVRILRDAGFSMLVEDFQFHVPHLTDRLRATLEEYGMEIASEGRLNPADSEVMVKGSWSSKRPLPMQGVKLTREFANVLSASKVSYFQVDLVALNDRYAEQWESIISKELLALAGMKLRQ